MNIRTAICSGLSVLLVLCLTPIAFAQQGGGNQPDLVGNMDKDSDGKVSKSEWNRNPAVFATYDKNSDGFIASDEKPSGIPDLALLDINGDGKVTKDEWPGPEALFSEFDQNKDGYLVESECTPPSSGGGGAQGGAAPGGAAPAGGDAPGAAPAK